MKISDIKVVIKKSLENGFRRPLYMWGPPGIGKSTLIKQVADELGVGFIDFRLIYYDTVDMRGIPFPAVVEEDRLRNLNSMDEYIPVSSVKTVWFQPSILPHDGRGILFLDELNAAEPDIQKVALQLALDRKIDNYRLPDGWVVVAAGNRSEDRAYTYDLSAPLANRFIHINVDVDVESWIKWAENNNIHPYVIAYVSKQRHHLFQFNPDSDAVTFATPRTWEYVSDIVYSFTGSVRDELIIGTVGDGVGIEFLNFIKMFEKFPDIDDILNDPEGTPVPEEHDIRHAVCNSLINVVNGENIGKIKKYVERFGDEYEIAFIRMIAEVKPALLETSEMALWAVKFAKYLN
jgi:hypothetical protein